MRTAVSELSAVTWLEESTAMFGHDFSGLLSWSSASCSSGMASSAGLPIASTYRLCASVNPGTASSGSVLCSRSNSIDALGANV